MRIRSPGRTSLAFILKPAGRLFTPGSINESWRRLLLPARRRSNALKKEAGILDNAGLPKTHGASTRGCLLRLIAHLMAALLTCGSTCDLAISHQPRVLRSRFDHKGIDLGRDTRGWLTQARLYRVMGDSPQSGFLAQSTLDH